MESNLALDFENGFRYLEAGIKAKDHSPIYKMHKYFARRPHNVFRHLIEWYTQRGDIVLDPFCGGGVTLVEGLHTERKVIAVDINPLATFISDAQTTKVNLGDYSRVMGEVWTAMSELVTKYYSTSCRKCGEVSPVRWYELAYFAVCDNCNNQSLLSNDNKFISHGKPMNGVYKCTHCGSSIKAVDAPRDGYELLTVTYRCSCTPDRQTALASPEDRALMAEFEENFDSLVSQYNLWYPKDIIPEDWDRQKEDCLLRKSVVRFSDFFTKRNLFFNAYLYKLIKRYRPEVSPELYQLLLFTFSAVIRHTNNMTISTGNWMDGRPVSWAKHAYWIPNQFVEVNPIEYVEKRRDAVVSGIKYLDDTFPTVRKVENFSGTNSKPRYTHYLEPILG
jgi:putative DNA methylase